MARAKGAIDIHAAAALCKLLGDPTRLRIMAMIAAAPGREMHVGAVVRELGLSQPAVSHQLAALRMGGLLESRRDAGHVRYRVADGASATVEGFLGGLA